MRICYLAPANSVHSHRWIKYFADKGHQIEWISLFPLSGRIQQGVVYHEILINKKNPLSVLLTARKVKRLIGRISPDLLHILSTAIYGVVGAASRFHPTVTTALGSDVLVSGRSLPTRPFVKYALHSTDLVTCDADHMIESMQRLGVSRDKLHLIYFGVDTQKFSPENRDEELRRKLGIFDNPAVLSLRSFYPVYNIETLIRAIPLVLEEVRNAVFCINGVGPEEQMLKELARRLGVANNIKFMGVLPEEDFPKYIASMDLYVSTSLSDAGISAGTAESMASGLAAVVTDFGENSKWVIHNHSGFVFPKRDFKALAKHITWLLKNPDQRKRSGENGRRIITDRNNYFTEMEKMERLYEKVARHAGN